MPSTATRTSTLVPISNNELWCPVVMLRCLVLRKQYDCCGISDVKRKRFKNKEKFIFDSFLFERSVPRSFHLLLDFLYLPLNFALHFTQSHVVVATWRTYFHFCACN